MRDSERAAVYASARDELTGAGADAGAGAGVGD